MHKIFFGLKRAYHGSLRSTRRALTSLGLTAARFDLLYILEKAGGQMPQREIQRALGVAASTVSRMLRSLEELGLVLREIMLDDNRCTWVQLTFAGHRRVRRAVRKFIQTGHAQLMVDSALCPDRWHKKNSCRSASVEFDRTLRRLRHAYWDVATLTYPWVPGDWSKYHDGDQPWSARFPRAGP